MVQSHSFSKRVVVLCICIAYINGATVLNSIYDYIRVYYERDIRTGESASPPLTSQRQCRLILHPPYSTSAIIRALLQIRDDDYRVIYISISRYWSIYTYKAGLYVIGKQRLWLTDQMSRKNLIRAICFFTHFFAFMFWIFMFSTFPPRSR